MNKKILTADLPVLDYDSAHVQSDIEEAFEIYRDKDNTVESGWRLLYNLYSQGDDELKAVINKVFIVLCGVSLVTMLRSIGEDDERDLI